MKKKNATVFLMILIAVILLYFVFKQIGAENIWNALFSFSLQGIFWGLLVTAIFIFFAVLRWRVILENKGKDVSFKGLTYAWLTGWAGSYFTPFALLGGEIARVYVLKKNSNVSIKTGVVSVIIDKILEASVNFLFIILGISLFIYESLTLPPKLRILVLLVLLPIFGIIFFYFKASRKESIVAIFEKPLRAVLKDKKKRDVIFSSEDEIFAFFSGKNKVMWKAIFISIIRAFFRIFQFWILLFFLGLNPSLYQVIIIVAFATLSYYIIPLPGAIGVFEAIQAFVFTQIGFIAEMAIAFSLIFRGIEMLVAILGVIIAFHFGAVMVKDKIFNNNGNNNSIPAKT